MSNSGSDQRQANRQQLYAAASSSGCDFIVLAAYRRQQRTNDTAYKFRQESNFLYYTGLEEPDLIFVADLKSGDDWLMAPKLSREQTVFDGDIDRDKLARRSGLAVIVEASGWERLKLGLARSANPKVGVITPLTQTGLETNIATSRLVRRLRALTTKPTLFDLSPMTARQRAIKQTWEVKFIQQAIDITADALTTVKQNLTTYNHEYEVEAAITSQFRRQNAVHAYEPIVAGGRNALTLHYIDNSARLSPGKLVLIDVGAEVQGYAADITRTYPTAGQFNTRQSEIYAAVLDIQKYAIGLLKPGRGILEYIRKTDDYAQKALKLLGLIRQPPRSYLPHGISHGLGLDVHDRLAHEQFKTGMVLTVEPGIYIDEESIGVRIEDDVLITERGAKVLSRQLAK